MTTGENLEQVLRELAEEMRRLREEAAFLARVTRQFRNLALSDRMVAEIVTNSLA